jgi:hypothetical protein
VCVLVDLPAKYEREADVEREVELVDVVKICARTARDHQPIISRSADQGPRFERGQPHHREPV